MNILDAVFHPLLDSDWTWLAGALGGYWLFDRLWRAWFGSARAAEKIHRNATQLYSAPHEFVTAEPRNFPHADLRHYEDTAARLAALGFRGLGDVEDATVSRVYPQMRTFIRMMAAEDGAVAAGIYHVKIRGWMAVLTWVRILPAHMRTVDLETEFSDGTFLTTANTLGADLSSAVPGIERQSLATSTPVEELLAVHRRRLAEIVARGIQPRRVRTGADYRAVQHRLDTLKNRERAARGHVDLAQFDRCATGFAGVETEEVRAHLERIQEEEVSGVRC